MKRTLWVVAALFCVAQIANAQEIECIQLWENGKMPNNKPNVEVKDSIVGRYIYIVDQPKLYVFPADKDKNTGLSMLIVPGGGYMRLPAIYERGTVTDYYTSRGITVFYVCHRLPASPDLEQRWLAPLQDIQRAMRIIRANATKWNIDPEHVGINGTSAGGHGASTLCTHPEDVSAVGDAYDKYAYKPAFAVMMSPVITMDLSFCHKGSRNYLLGTNPPQQLVDAYSNEKHVTKDTPPAILFHADDDHGVPPMNSVAYYMALNKAGVKAALHIFTFGGHNIGLGKDIRSAEEVGTLTIAWLKDMGFLKK